MKNICIVGAGLVGSLLSVYLSKRGYTVDVYERRADWRKKDFVGGRSINLALSDRGWKALAGVGLADQIKKIALPMEGRMIHDMEGKTNMQAYGKKGQAIYSVSRGLLNLELVNATEPDPKVTYHFNQKCKKVFFESNEIIFEHTVDKSVEQKKYDLIIGADGAFSAVRWNMMKTPNFNFSQEYLEHGYKELTILPNEDGTHKLDKNALHIWPRGSFMLIALPNLDGSFTCTLFFEYEGKRSFAALDSDEKVMEFFQTYFKDALDLMPNLIEDWHDNPTSSLITIKCKPWHNNNAFLIGDASHAIVPFYGQGMNSGFEDCTVLNEMLDEFDDDWEKVIPHFSKERKPDADAISDLAMRNFIEMRDLVDDENFLLRKKIEKEFVKHFPEKYLPLYSMVTFSHLPYSKALNEGKKHDALFKEIFKIEQIEEKLEKGIAKIQFLDWINTIK